MPLDPQSHVPIYEQIVEHIRGSVVSGVYRPEEPLPSIRTLALELLVNPNTVQRAYQELERQGLIYMRRGLGAFVSKDGNLTGQSRLEQTIVDRFTEVVQLGRSANMTAAQLQALLRKALAATSPGPTQPPDTEAPSRGNPS